MSGIALKKRPLVTLAAIWVGWVLLMSVGIFTLASNATSASRIAVASAGPATLPAPAAIEANPPASQLPALAPGNDRTGERYRSGFACTGSMRPTIDCGDEGVFLRPPFQEPLKAGDIISFSPDLSCRYYKNQTFSKAHRIISIRTENGFDYYTTKGDATKNADLCEITADQIDGKLVEIRQGVRPQDILDTAAYDLTKESVNRLKDQYEYLKVQFDQNKAAYDDRGEEYQDMVTSYTDGRVEYVVVVDFHRQLETERIGLNLQRDQLNDLAREVNAGIREVDRLYLELFTQ